jgi:alpha-1,3-rhamnosyl/mannosyltransferase
VRRIGLDARTLDDRFPGVARHVENLLLGLAQVELSEAIAVLHDPRSARAVRALESMGSRFERVPVRVRAAGLSEQFRLPWRARGLHLDLVHAPFPVTPLLWPSRVTVTVHDLIPLDRPEAIGSRVRRLLWRLALAAALRRASLVMTGSETSRARLARHAPWLGERLRVTPNGVSPRFRPVSERERRLAREWVGADRFVLFVGAARRYRNLEGLLDAWARLEASGRTRGHVLVLAGAAGPVDVAALTRRRGGRGTIPAGRVEEALLPALYSAATAFVHPSPDEGFALPVLEAMACGTPVACPSGGAAAEVAGAVGWRFDPASTDELAETLATALAEAPAARLAEAALERASLFTCARAARATLECWRLALAGSPPAGATAPGSFS